MNDQTKPPPRVMRGEEAQRFVRLAIAAAALESVEILRREAEAEAAAEAAETGEGDAAHD
jgi:hypothetical protein